MASKTFPSFTFSLECGERGYGQIHKTGCRDLQDGERIESTDPMEFHEEFWPENGPFQDEKELLANLAPCAKEIYRKG